MIIDIRKHVLQYEIEVEDKTYRIHTDYTYWINFIEALKEPEPELDFMFIDPYNAPKNKQAAFKALCEFCNPPEDLPNADDTITHNHIRYFDYIKDSTMIYAAFMQVYGIDLVDTPLHWHKFLALFNNLTGTRLNEIMGYRGYDKNDKESYEHRMERLQEQWELEEIISPEEEALNDKFNAQFD